MKRFLLIGILFIFAVGSVMATDDRNAGVIPDPSKVNLVLNLDSDKYSFGFSTEDNYTSMGATAFELTETVNNDFSVNIKKSDNNSLYLFYKVLTDSNTVKLTLSIDSPLYYWDGTNLTSGTNTEETINYQAELSTAGTEWKGEVINGKTIYSESPEEGKETSVTVGIRDSSTKSYLTYGSCRIFISSTENLSSKVPGTYKSTMTLTLASV